MCCNHKKSDLALLEDVLDKYASVEGSLITILQKAQEIYGYLPTDVLYHIAEKTGKTPARVMGVATFYTQFRFKPVGKYLILLCQGTACHVNGSERIADAIYEAIGIRDGETTEDGLFTLTHVACLGCCSLSPVMMINDDTYGSLTPSKVKEILTSLKEEA
ncbi:MAG: NADH-quinone oxidoreductase subunit NuoE [Ruminococcaceae bacterium]|nr:NADH-quinone oxidoreductase subunit NuoE [Oscillospiraceae bacterium]